MPSRRNGKPPRQLFTVMDSVGRSELAVRTSLVDARRVARGMDATPGSGEIQVFGPYTLGTPIPSSATWSPYRSKIAVANRLHLRSVRLSTDTW